MRDPVRVSVVASDPVLEAGAASTLHGYPDLDVTYWEGAASVTVVMVDAVHQGVLDTVRETCAADHCPEVVLVATDLTAAEALQAIVAGARGLLRRREATPGRLARTVRAVAGGECTVPADLLDQLVGAAFADERRDDKLSERERVVLHLLSQGCETDEIAEQLNYSARTVVNIVQNITKRFQLRNRAHAVAYALRGGLL